MKYDKEAPFEDPVVRCDSCGRLLLMKDVHKNGLCGCGNRKVRAILAFNLREYLKMRFWWKVDPDYLKTFGRSA
jgi:DNA-directed RNA polymerase subunit RPC12/RpoP